MTKKIEPVKVSLHDIGGRRITQISRGCGKVKPARGKVPTARYLLNFDVDFEHDGGSAGHLLVLDPYGACDSGMAHDLLRYTEVQDNDIAVNRDTGAVVLCCFHRLGRNIEMSVSLDADKMWSIPPQWLGRLDELRTKKRPYGFCFDNGMLHNIVTGYYGREHLETSLHIMLEFNDEILELDQDGGYRVSTPWS